MPLKQPTPPAERFEVFRANHGPLESPLTERLLGTFFDHTIARYFGFVSPSCNLQEFVSKEMKRLAPDWLVILEMAADWSADPMAAAGRILREELEARVKAEDDARKAREEAELRAVIKAKAEAFVNEHLAPAAPASGAPGEDPQFPKSAEHAPGAPEPSQAAPKASKAPDPAAVAAGRH